MFGTVQRLQSFQNLVSVLVTGTPIALLDHIRSLWKTSTLVSLSTSTSEKFAKDAITSQVSIMCVPQCRLFSYLFIIGFRYRLHVLTPRSGRHVRETGAQALSRVFSCALDRPFVIERYLQPKYQTTGVNYTALYDHSLLQPYSVQSTLLACQCRGPRIKSQMCLGDWGIETRTLRTSSRVYNHQTTRASPNMANMVAGAIVSASLDYCNSLFSGM